MQTSALRSSPARLDGGETFASLAPAPRSRRVFPIPRSSGAATAPVNSNLSPRASLAMSVPIRPVAPTRQTLSGLLIRGLVRKPFPGFGDAEPLVQRDVEGLLYGLEDLRVALPDPT